MAFEPVPFASIAKLKQGRYLAPEQMSATPTSEKNVPVVGGNGVLGYTDKSSYDIGVPLITCRGSRCGLLQWVNAPVWVSNNAIACDTGSLEGNQVLRYVISATPFVDVITGSAQPQITVGHLAAKHVNMPPPSIWHELVSVLGPLDERIELLGNTNVTLEAIAQAIFKCWFLDFDPVRAKAEGREPEGMDAATAALFPSEFEDSELGQIPKNWRTGTLRQCCDNVRSQARPDALDPSTPYIGLEHMPRRSIALAEWGTTGGLASGKSWYRPCDVLFGKLRPYFHKVGVASNEGVCSTDILVIRSKKPCWLAFSAMHLSSEAMISYATQLSNGAKMPRTNWNDIAAYKVAMPDEASAGALDAVIRPMIGRMHANIDAMHSLAALRDTLLPRLISGKLRLPEAEAVVAEMAHT